MFLHSRIFPFTVPDPSAVGAGVLIPICSGASLALSLRLSIPLNLMSVPLSGHDFSVFILPWMKMKTRIRPSPSLVTSFCEYPEGMPVGLPAQHSFPTVFPPFPRDCSGNNDFFYFDSIFWPQLINPGMGTYGRLGQWIFSGQYLILEKVKSHQFLLGYLPMRYEICRCQSHFPLKKWKQAQLQRKMIIMSWAFYLNTYCMPGTSLSVVDMLIHCIFTALGSRLLLLLLFFPDVNTKAEMESVQMSFKPLVLIIP